MQADDEYVYRLRGSAPSEQVRVVSIGEGRQNGFRADVEFLDRIPPGRSRTSGEASSRTMVGTRHLRGERTRLESDRVGRHRRG